MTLSGFMASLPVSLRRQKLLEALCRFRVVSPVQPLQFNGRAKAWVDLRDATSRAAYLARSYWPEFPPLVAAFLRIGGDLFDAGANLGLVTFGVVPLVADLDTKCHLFEANARLIPLLELSAREWPDRDFSIQHCCVTDVPGVSFHTLPDSEWSHGLIAERGDEVRNLALDDYVADRRVERIGFLKLDVEGWELHALRGAQRTLESGLVQAGFIEINPGLLRRAGVTSTDVLDTLQRAGFDIYFAGLWDDTRPQQRGLARVSINGTALGFSRATPLPASFVQGDVLVIHRSHPVADDVRSATQS